MNTSRQANAKVLIETENRLNHLGKEEFGLPIGSLLSDVWRQRYNEDRIEKKKYQKLYNYTHAVYYLLKRVFYKRQPKSEFNKSQLLVARSSNKAHIKGIVRPIEQLQIAQNEVSKIDACFHLVNRWHLVCIGIQSFLKTIKVVSAYHEVACDMRKDLYVKILQFLTWEKLLGQMPELKGLVVDFDRSIYSPLVLAGKKCNVITITLQHGAINPPYGYVPLIADKILVWGELWKEILLQMNVEANQIEVAGNSNIRYKTDYIEAGNLKRIGIAPNPVGDKTNKSVWLPVIQKINSMNLDVVIKLHPSQNKRLGIGKLFSSVCPTFESSEITNAKFFSSIDLLITSTSGIGYESVYAGTPVMIVREFDGSIANDAIMIDQLGFPEICVSTVKDKLIKYHDKLESLRITELKNLDRLAFKSIGEEADKEIMAKINHFVNEVD